VAAGSAPVRIPPTPAEEGAVKLIRFKYDGGPVTVEIAVEGLVEWRYKYVTDTNRLIRTSEQESPFVHTVGMPDDLHLDSNSWDFKLVNTGDAEAEYAITIRWHQDGEELATWSAGGTLAGGELAIDAGDAFLTRA
jgi:hypothetical protein